MKNLKYLIFIFILFLTPNVFALGELNSSSYSQANGFSSSSRYDYSTDNYLGDQTNFSVGVLGNRYNGKSYYFQFNFHYNIIALKTYDVTFTSDTYDFTNQINSNRVVPLCYSSFASNFNTKECENIGIVSVKRGSTSSGNSKEFTIRFTTNSNYSYWGFKIAGGLYNLTSVNNFKISNISFKEVDTSNSTDIINNANQNTQEIINNSTSNANNIIDNNTQNTNDIINNNNQNTQSIIENMSNCNNNFLPNDFTTHTDSGLTLTKNSDGSIHVSGTASQSTFVNFFSVPNPSNYFDNDVFASLNSVCTSKGYCLTLPVNGGFTISNGIIWSYVDSGVSYDYTYYPMLTKSPLPSQFIPPQQQVCTSKIDDTTNAINETNNYLQDNSDPYIADNDFLSMFNSIGFNDPLQHLLQLPVQFINALVSQSNTCQAVNLGTLWGVSLSLPCINLQNIIGSGVWSTIDVLMSIGLLVVIIKNLYETFSNLLTMGGEKEARDKFDMPTPMEFLSMILGGDR